MINKNSLDMIAQAHNELVQISCRGDDTIHMCKALTWIRSSYEQLLEAYNKEHENTNSDIKEDE